MQLGREAAEDYRGTLNINRKEAAENRRKTTEKTRNKKK